MQNNSINCRHAELANAQGVFLILTEENSLPCWRYLLVDSGQLAIFKGLLNFLPLNLTLVDYGKIIHSGAGKFPPQNVITQIANADFSNRNPAAQSEVFCLLSDDANGREFYTYLDVPYYLMDKFKQISAQSGEFEFTEYGEILHSDWGQPTPEIISMMNEKYGVSAPVFNKTVSELI
jgi:hypothetical protein